MKDGAGTFVATKQQQTYTGGTTIAAGVLKAGAYGKYYPLGAQDSFFTVNAGATFDFNGQYDYNYYKCILAGGTLANTGAAMGSASGNHYWGSLGDITLTEDSFALATKHLMLYGGTLNLGGNALNVTVGKGSQLYMNRMTVSNGTFRVTQANGDEAWLHLYGGSDLCDTTLELAASVALYQNVPVKNLVNSYNGPMASGPGSFRVSGTFTPVSNAFHNVTLLDGARLDLTRCTGAWSNRSDINHLGGHYLGVAHGANICIDITGRTDLHTGDRVLEWETEPELVHRWSFNGTYADSVGGTTAEPMGTVTLGANSVTLPGGTVGTGNISLGSYLLPTNQGPVTVEIWLAQHSYQPWTKLFTCGVSGNCFSISGANASSAVYSSVIVQNSKSSGNDTAWDTFGTANMDAMEHFSISFNDRTSSTGYDSAVVLRHAVGGSFFGGSLPSLNTGWKLEKLDQTNTHLGWGTSWWKNTDSNASFDEVRIWKGSLTHADLEANAAASCDTVLKSFRETAKFKFRQNDNLWGARALADGLYLDRRGFILIVR